MKDSKRILSLDLLRIIAAFLIVAFHIIPWQNPAYDIALKWTIPFFFIMSGFFDARHLGRHSVDSVWLWKRISRLAVPYAFWTTLRLVDLEVLSPFSLLKQYLLCSPTSTLWFLWTLIVVTLLVALASKVFPLRTIGVASIILAAAYCLVCQSWENFGVVGSWLHSNPGYALQAPFLWMAAYVAGIALRRKNCPAPMAIFLFVTGALLATLLSSGSLSYNYSWGVAGIGHVLMGIGIFSLALRVDASQFKAFAKLGSASLGVYLVHPALIRVFGIATSASPFIGNINNSPLAKTIVVSILSLAMTLILLKIPVLKKIVE